MRKYIKWKVNTTSEILEGWWDNASGFYVVKTEHPIKGGRCYRRSEITLI